MTQLLTELHELLSAWLNSRNLLPEVVEFLCPAIILLVVLVLAVLADLIARKGVTALLHHAIGRTKLKFDDVLRDTGVFTRLAHVAPALVIYALAPAAFPGDAELAALLQRIGLSVVIFAGMLVVNALLSAVNAIYSNFAIARHKPIKSYVQITKSVLYTLTCILIVAAIMGKSPWTFVGGLGAFMALAMLVFKDSILGVVASIRLAANDMVRVGDWIEMPSYNANGDVIDVSLHTIKVQNWDKTITCMPTRCLMTESFKNWRGMTDSGGRRIKRSLRLDFTSIRFCTDEMLERFRRIQLISGYIDAKLAEIAESNRENEVDETHMVNGRHLTNIGTLRAYILAYLRSHPMIHQEMTLIVRLLEPDKYGVPIQVYAFCKDTAWVNYEAVQSDIFDHILAIVPEFDLKLYQR